MSIIYGAVGFKPWERFSHILDRNRGMGPGFDLLRILLAVILFIGHAKWIAGTPSLALMYEVGDHGINTIKQTTEAATQAGQWVGFTKPFKLALVPAFFALSGFLVMGSAFRIRTTSTFLAHRALRIFPALAVETLLSAILLGVLVTTLPLQEYFQNPQFLRYLGNIFGFVYMHLPGVFESNTVKGIVNVNLWTLPAEFVCYVITAALLLTRLLYDRKLFTVVFIIATASLAIGHHLTQMSNPNGPFPAHVITYYFFVGVLFYHYKDKIPAHVGLFILAATATYFLLSVDQFIYLSPIPLTYCTLCFGMMRMPKIKLLSSGDYSYGIYLYGFPITQTLFIFFPSPNAHAVTFTVIAGALTLFFSVLSWHLIEKRCLAFKKNLPTRLFPVPT